MVEPTATTTEDGTENAKNHFTKAMEEAKAGAQALAGEYREKLTKTKDDLSDEAKSRSGDAREKASAFASDAKVKATEYANEGKARTSKAIVGLSKMIDDNAGLIDDKVGAKYGDYARTASKSMQDAATKLDEKSLDELGEDAKEFVRKSPGLAVGMAVAAGFLFGRIFKKSK
ncbi:apolipoprotein A1/A4/E family protein [Novosphingobium mangrovi (ex Huang et al. 2023)]|uniref:Apolipoprotein A1/A4/E family protein n=1 Tax=Novosphingobium mangrovi (ex Huang et al. 2023) TaxID=2976432 RepID=A0ABT2I7P2_9SPHN|nr:apolipoprotein A1/A4/E family protein [Novosphingobium mangrovi (ex Huang et al. 2023)]MCT2400821.1 apolipoprotein A1/A4/E family protein [Novosphingobium mangrovi (ex Huang et al. 2023)]